MTARSCQDCRFFRLGVGRDGKSCQDIGERPNGVACESFRPEPQVGALPPEAHRDVFHEILAESFVLEQDVRLAVDTIKAQLQTQGASIDVDGKDFRSSAGRLVDLYVVYRLIMTVGLGRYADEIMAAEIQRRFLPDRRRPPKFPHVARETEGEIP